MITGDTVAVLNRYAVHVADFTIGPTNGTEIIPESKSFSIIDPAFWNYGTDIPTEATSAAPFSLYEVKAEAVDSTDVRTNARSVFEGFYHRVSEKGINPFKLTFTQAQMILAVQDHHELLKLATHRAFMMFEIAQDLYFVEISGLQYTRIHLYDYTQLVEFRQNPPVHVIIPKL